MAAGDEDGYVEVQALRDEVRRLQKANEGLQDVLRHTDWAFKKINERQAELITELQAKATEQSGIADKAWERVAKLEAALLDVTDAESDPAYDADPRLLIRSLGITAKYALEKK